MTSRAAAGERPMVGSSMSSRRGEAHHRPPDGEQLLLTARERPGGLPAAGMKKGEPPVKPPQIAPHRHPIGAQIAPANRFSSIDSPAKTRRPSGTSTIPRRTRASTGIRSIASPAYSILPADSGTIPAQHPQQGGLARPIRPYNAQAFPLRQLEIHPMQRGMP